MTEYLTDQQFEAALEKYKGAYVQLWLFSVSHKRLVVRLSFKGRKEDLYIVGVSCKHITGAFSWRDANMLLMHEDILVEGEKESITKLVDRKANFELVCDGGLAMVISSDPDLLNNFDTYASS